MLKNVVIDGKTIEQVLNKEVINNRSVKVNFEEGPTIEWNDTEEVLTNLPDDKHGVYVIFKEKNCLYVGKTWNEKGFKGRISSHEKFHIFEKEADYISLFYIDKQRTNEILLFERIKISQLEPSLNRDDDIAKLRSNEIMKNSIDYYNLYLSKVLLDEKLLQKLENQEIDIVELKNKLSNRFNLVRREIPLETFLYDTDQIDYTLTKYFCSVCKDTGNTEKSVSEKDYDCDCWIGKQKFFDEYGHEQDEV